MKIDFKTYEIDDDPARLDFDRVHHWLTSAYWTPGVAREKVEKAAAHSAIAIGAYLDMEQVGYCRVVSDLTRFSYLADVYVDEQHRGHGIARALVRFVQDHPLLEDVQGCMLFTRDAHGVYSDVGFAPLIRPENWMLWNRQASPSM